jgi:hypothetical protein
MNRDSNHPDVATTSNQPGVASGQRQVDMIASDHIGRESALKIKANPGAAHDMVEKYVPGHWKHLINNHLDDRIVQEKHDSEREARVEKYNIQLELEHRHTDPPPRPGSPSPPPYASGSGHKGEFSYPISDSDTVLMASHTENK